MSQISLLLTCLLLLSPPAKPDHSVKRYDYCNMQNDSWQGGEQVTYKLYYQLNFIWIAAGEATFKVKDLGDRYYIAIDGRTINAFEWFYKVQDHYESVIDKKTLLPLSFTREVHEGKYQWWDKFFFDQVHHKVQASKGWPDKATKYYEAELTGCMHDLISIIYNVRNVDFDQYREGQQFDVKVFIEEEYPLKVELRGKNVEARIRGLGKQSTYLIRPQVVSGHFFKDDTRMDIYISDDGNKLPLMIESPVSVGKVKAVLVDYQGLRYPTNFQ
ncbi:MAG: DUF3108 domain-containing protein [Saprospiraceae bacterium]